MPSWQRVRRQHLDPAVAALSAAFLLSATSPLSTPLRPAAPGQEQSQKSGREADHPANELALSGLRPGRDTRATALARYHKPRGASDEKTASWRDLCRGRELRVDFGEDGVVESVTVSAMTGPRSDCRPETKGMPAEAWQTGRGLSLGEMRERVVAIYGQPESQGPASKQGDESEFYYYAFDWAGWDVPQVLEVTCDKKTGRVVQITLAAQSL